MGLAQAHPKLCMLVDEGRHVSKTWKFFIFILFYTQTHTHMYTHTYTHTYTHAHTYTCTHTYTYSKHYTHNKNENDTQSTYNMYILSAHVQRSYIQYPRQQNHSRIKHFKLVSKKLRTKCHQLQQYLKTMQFVPTYIYSSYTYV